MKIFQNSEIPPWVKVPGLELENSPICIPKRGAPWKGRKFCGIFVGEISDPKTVGESVFVPEKYLQTVKTVATKHPS